MMPAATCRCGVLPIILAIAAFVVPMSGASSPDFVVVVHRHGARMPALPFNASILCPELPCGALLPEGKDMLQSLGRYMAASYPNLVQGPSYNPYLVSVRSTSITRTIQSADAFLWGAFPNVSAFYPAIENVPIATDTLLDPYGAWPTSVLHSSNPLIEEEQSAAVANFAESIGIDTAALQSFAPETTQYALCPAYPLYCMFAAQDLAESLKARGQLEALAYPALNAFGDRLNDVVEFYNRLKFVYNSSIAHWRGTGSFGQPLAAAIVELAENHAAGAVSFSLKEYSAHDTTLMPLYVSLGILDEMRPKFAEAVIFEFYGMGDPSDVTVRAIRGYPQQIPGPHAYAFSQLLLSCMSTQGVVVKNASCSISDFKRALTRFDPQPGGAVGGQCFFDADDQAAGCPPTSTPVSSANAACAQFRQACPAEACLPFGTLNFSSLACMSPASSPARESIPTVWVAAVGVLSGVVVLLSLVAACLALTRRRARKADPTQYAAFETVSKA